MGSFANGSLSNGLLEIESDDSEKFVVGEVKCGIVVNCLLSEWFCWFGNGME